MNGRLLSTVAKKPRAAVSVQTRARHNYYIAPFGKANFGPGGRSSSSGITATVFGGYGFVGRYFMSELGKFVVVCASPPWHTHVFSRFFSFMTCHSTVRCRRVRVACVRAVPWVRAGTAVAETHV